MSDSRVSGNNSGLDTEGLALNEGAAFLSSYSPAKLTHLRQPVPSDLPPHLDSGIFTFQDALEDLLAVSQGNPLPDIHSRYQQSRMLRQMYPHGEPTWLWIKRLESQGLIRPARGSYIARASQVGFDELQRCLEEDTEELWRSIRDDPRNQEAVAQVGKVFREVRDQFSGHNGYSSQWGDSKNTTKTEPDHFDDLYLAINSAFADGRSAWDALQRTINKDVPRRMDELERQMGECFKENKPSAPTENPANDNEKETRSEWVDAFGYKHTTIKRKLYDENGKEIGSSTSVTIKSAENDDSNVIENSDGNTDVAGKRKRGWFW
ncbi:hypothetical protein MY11210_007246 [Beauveria gryllotalpidicola]